MDQQADSSPGLIRVWLKKPDFKKEKKKVLSGLGRTGGRIMLVSMNTQQVKGPTQ